MTKEIPERLFPYPHQRPNSVGEANRLIAGLQPGQWLVYWEGGCLHPSYASLLFYGLPRKSLDIKQLTYTTHKPLLHFFQFVASRDAQGRSVYLYAVQRRREPSCSKLPTFPMGTSYSRPSVAGSASGS